MSNPIEMSKVFSQIKAYARNRKLPMIPINPTDVHIVRDPVHFYELLLEGSRACKSRLALSALYIGAGKRSEVLIQAISDNLAENNDLRVDIVLDAQRGTRRDRWGRSSVTALSKVFLYPNTELGLVTTKRNRFLNFLIRNRPVYDEVLSTYHGKAVIFDNEVILSGANLSEDYFVSRQDHYLNIKNSETLSDYVMNLLNVLKRESSDLKSKIIEHNNATIKLLEQQYPKNDHSTFIIPLMQYRSSGITEKEDFILFLRDILPEDAKMHLATGYFNPSPSIEKIQFSSALAPGEKANGFYNARVPLDNIPRLYSVFQQRYVKKYPKCKVFLYNRKGHTFHAKGIWVEGIQDLYVHVFGSSNFNYRSSNRDLETEYVIVTSDEDLARRLEEKRSSLLDDSIVAKPSSFKKISLIFRLATMFLRSVL